VRLASSKVGQLPIVSWMIMQRGSEGARSVGPVRQWNGMVVKREALWQWGRSAIGWKGKEGWDRSRGRQWCRRVGRKKEAVGDEAAGKFGNGTLA
jgi:hypothetical protein